MSEGGGMRDTTVGVLADLAQIFLIALFVHPDAATLEFPRTWVAQWHRDCMDILAYLRAHAEER